MRILLPVRVQADGWLGGANYFLSLVSAMRAREPDNVELFVASNRPDTFAGPGLAGVHVLEAPWLDPSNDWRSRANAAIATLSAWNPSLQALARSVGAHLISHASPGPAPHCPILFWMPDFQHCRYPDFFSAAERGRRDRSIASTRRSGHILLSSESAAIDFRTYYPELEAVRTHVLRFTPLMPGLAASAGEPVASQLGLRDGDQVRVRQGAGEAVVPYAMDDKLPADCIRLAAAREETAGLGAMFGTIGAERVAAQQKVTV